MKITLIAAAAFCAFFVHDASAQPGKRDHRKRKGEPAPAAVEVRSMTPSSGAPGAAIHISGVGLPDNATITIGRRKVQATKAGRRGKGNLGFVVPNNIRPGVHKVSIDVGGVVIDVGNFEVTAGGGTASPPVAPIAVGEPHPHNTPAPAKRAPRKRWSSFGFPVVNSYFPAKGDAGTKVTINGANFNSNLEVFLGDTKIAGAKITPTTITFKVPKRASDGVITVRGAGKRRALAVGQFNVVKFDYMAERKKREQERRKAAEEAWKQRQKQLAKDRAARLKALQAREAELAASREQRRAQRQAEMRARFKAAFLADEETQAEMALHAERLARLQRMLRLAEANSDGKLVVRIEIAVTRENERHDNRMAALEAAFKL